MVLILIFVAELFVNTIVFICKILFSFNCIGKESLKNNLSIVVDDKCKIVYNQCVKYITRLGTSDTWRMTERIASLYHSSVDQRF